MSELGPQRQNYSDARGREQLLTGLAGLLATQHGLAAGWQLREIGFTRARIYDWVKSGRLIPVRPGVYSTSHAPLTQAARWMAAVLACSDDALLSHLSAATGLKMREVDPVVIHVTARRGVKPKAGVRLHRPSSMPPAEDRRMVDHIPVTSPARTFFDCAGLLGDRSLLQMLSAAEREGYFTPADLAARLPERRRGCTGIANARRILTRYSSAPGLIRSGLEQRFWQLCADHGPPLPQTNVLVAGYEVDFLWEHLHLIVETDGGPWHSTVIDRKKDATRDDLHRSLGYEVHRVSDTQMDQPNLVASWLEITVARLVERYGTGPAYPSA